MAQTQENPIGLNGVDFIEFSGPDAEALDVLFRRMGFKEVSQVPGKAIRLFRQNNINFILNTEPGTFATDFAKLHGGCVCSTGFRVLDAKKAMEEAVKRGAKVFEAPDSRKGATPFPAVYGIGDSLIYFVDENNHEKLYTDVFKIKPGDESPKGHGLRLVDHFTNNVPVGAMDKWANFYTDIFGFREAKYFDIRGKSTGLLSRAMRSPCGKFSVPINEPKDPKSQIQEYLDEYKGPGIQHIALTTDDIVGTLETMKNSQIEFLKPPPATYYAQLKDRVPNVIEAVDRLQKHAILVDGDMGGYLLQIFTKNVIGPIFFEVIQRKGHDGFGDGNFQALFDAIEADQRERGYI